MKASVSKGLARLSSALFAVLVVAAPAPAQSDFEEAVQLYLRNQPEQALAGFQAVLAENPSNEEALHYLEQGGREVFFLMLLKEGKYEAVAKRFLELAKIARKEKANDPAAISALVDQAMNGDYLERRDALFQLSANHGEYGAAPFVAFLGDEDNPERRVAAIYCLNQLAGDAVLPLIAGLESDRERLVWNAAACLGAIGDRRAVPALKRVFEVTDSATVRAAADDALEKITGSSAAALPGSSDLHLDAAVKHFNKSSDTVMSFDTTGVVWQFRDGAVTAVDVPPMLRQYKLAEQHCFDAIQSPRAQAVLLATYAAEQAAIEAAAELGGDLDAEMTESLSKQVDVALASGGADRLSAALEFAMNNDAPKAAVVLIQSLRETGAGTAALEKALDSEYKVVRYHAAFALAESGKTAPKVVSRLASALGEDSIRTVLVVDDQDDTRTALAAMLSEAGYAVLTADSGGIGFSRSRTLPLKDLIIVRAGLTDVTLDQFVFDSDYRTQASPIVVLTDESTRAEVEELYQGKGKVAGFLSPPMDLTVVTAAVEAALGELNAERAKAHAVAERAGRILAGLSRSELAPAKGDLLSALDRRDEGVLTAVLRAVGRLGAAEAVQKVAEIFADTGKSEEIRVAAAEALTGIFGNMQTNPGADVVDPVREAALGADSRAVRVAAGKALGSAAFLSAEERAGFLRSQRS